MIPALTLQSSGKTSLELTRTRAEISLCGFLRAQKLGCTNVLRRAVGWLQSLTVSSEEQPLQPEVSIAPLFHLRHEPPAAIDVWIVDIWPSRLFDLTLHVSHMLGESYEKKKMRKKMTV